MAGRLIFRKNSEFGWLNSGIILSTGEPGFSIDTETLKIGNGQDVWGDLPYITANPLGYVGTGAIVVGGSTGGVSFSGVPGSIAWSPNGTSIQGTTGLGYSVGNGIYLDALTINSMSNSIVLDASGQEEVLRANGSFRVNPVRGVLVNSGNSITSLNIGGETFYQSFYNPVTSEFVYVTTNGTPPTNDVLTLNVPFTSATLSVISGDPGYYTTSRKMSFLVPTNGSYAFTYSGISGTLYVVASTSTPQSMYTDSQSFSPSTLTSGTSYALVGGVTIYLLSNGSSGETLTITVTQPPPSLPPDVLTLGVPFTSAALTELSQSAGVYTTAKKISFVPPTTGSYTFTYSGIAGPLYQVYLGSTLESFIDDSEQFVPDSFNSGSSYTLSQGTTIYLLPTSSQNTHTITITISQFTPSSILALTLGVLFTSAATSVVSSNPAIYTTPYKMSILIPTTGYYTFNYGTSSQGIGGAYNVLESSTAQTFLEDSQNRIPPYFEDTIPYFLTQGTTIYLLPESISTAVIFRIRIDAVTAPVFTATRPILLGVENSGIETTLSKEAGFMSTSLLSFEVPTTGSYTFTFSGIDGPLLQVLSTTTPLTVSQDASNSNPTQFSSGVPYTFTQGTTIYMLPTSTTFMSFFTIEINSLAPPPQDDVLTLGVPFTSAALSEATTEFEIYTTPNRMSFVVPIDGNYIFTYSGINGGLYQVGSSSTPLTLFIDSTAITGVSPTIFESGTSYALEEGATIYFLSTGNSGDILSLTISQPAPPPEDLVLDNIYSAAPGILSVPTANTGFFTTPFLFTFTPPNIGNYKFTYSGINGGLYQVSSSSTPQNMYEVSGTLVPSSFTSGTSYALPAAFTIYLLPENNNAVDGFSITAEFVIETPSTPQNVPIGTEYTSFALSAPTANSDYYTTPHLLAVTISVAGSYTFTYSGISGNLYRVLVNSTPQTMYTDSEGLAPGSIPSGSSFTFPQGTIYLLPDDLTGEGTAILSLTITADLPPITPITLDVEFVSESSAVSIPTQNGGFFTTPYILSFTPPSTNSYVFTFSGINGYLINVLSTSTPQTMFTDSLGKIPPYFESGTSYNLTQGTTIYLLPEDTTGDGTLTLEINLENTPPPPSPPIPLLLDEQAITTSTLNVPTDASSFSLPHLLTFTPATTGNYRFTYTGATSLLQVLSTSTAGTMYADSIAESLATYESGISYTFTSGTTIYLLPVNSSSGGALTITVSVGSTPPQDEILQLGISFTSTSLTETTSTNQFTTPYKLVINVSQAGEYTFTYSGVDMLYNVSAASTPQTMYAPTNPPLVPLTFTSGTRYTLTQGQTIYMLPEGRATTDTITIIVELAEVPINNQNSSVPLNSIVTGTSNGTYTSSYVLSFDPPSTGTYSFLYAGQDVILYQVLNDTTAATLLNDIAGSSPQQFVANLKYNLVAGIKIYVMLTNIGQGDVNISVVPVTLPSPQSLTLGTLFTSSAMTEGTGLQSKFTTDYIMTLQVQIPGTYRFTYTGADTLYNVLSTTAPTSIYVDSTLTSPSTFVSETSYNLTAGTIYLMPETDNLNQQFSITAELIEVSLVAGEEYITNQVTFTTSQASKTTPFKLKFTAPTSDAYSFAYTGINVLYQALNSSTPLTILDDYLTTPYGSFSGPPILYYLNAGQSIYMFPVASSDATLTLTISGIGSPGTEIIEVYDEYNASEGSVVVIPTGLENGGKYTTPFVIEFTGSGGNRTYNFAYTGASDGLVRVNSASINASILDASNSFSILPSNQLSASEGEKIYLMPISSGSNDTLSLTITPQE